MPQDTVPQDTVSPGQLKSDRPDAALIQKWHFKLHEARKQFANFSRTTPNFKTTYVTELLAKLDQGIEYTETLAKLSLDEAKDISKRPESARGPAVVILVDESGDIKSMITYLLACHRSDPHALDLFMDTEGDQLDGGLGLFQIFLNSRNTVYLVDILKLKDRAFTTPDSKGNTLKAILESPTIHKAFYDVNGDSHSLWKSYGIHLAGVEDICLYGIAVYGGTAKEKGRGLDVAVKDNTKGDFSDAERAEWNQLKKWGKNTFKETDQMIKKIENGEDVGEGWVPVFNQRPIRPEVVQYAVQDVTVLPILLRHAMVYVNEMKDGRGDEWKVRIVAETTKRLAASQSDDFEGYHEGNADHGVPAWKGIK